MQSNGRLIGVHETMRMELTHALQVDYDPPVNARPCTSLHDCIGANTRVACRLLTRAIIAAFG